MASGRETAATGTRRRIHPAVTKTYAPRLVVFPLTALLIPAILPREQLTLAIAMSVVSLVYPYLVFFVSRRAEDTRKAGFNALKVDSFSVGLLIGIFAFRILPCTTYLLLATATLIVMGGWSLFFRAIWALPIGALLGGLLSGFHPFAPLGDLATILCYALIAGFVIIMAYSVNVTTKEAVAARHELREKNQQILAQTEMLASMSEFTHRVNASPHLDEVVDAVLQGLQKIFSFDLMGVGTIDEESGTLVVDREVGTAADTERFEDLAVPLGESGSVFAFCIANREPVYLPEITSDNISKMSPSDRAIYDTAPARALLVLPLIVAGKVIGTISFGNSTEPFDLTEGNIRTIEQYVSRLAAAIRNASLYEEAKAAREDAQRANETKSQFLANMSHELRTPMNAVIGYSEMLEEEAEDEGLTDFIPDLQKIQAAGRHLLELINGILDLSKIEANKMELYLETGPVERLVDGVVSTVKPLAERNGNTLELVKDESLGDMHVDRTKLRQALLNLLSNAAKFTENGTIRLEARRDRDPGGDVLRFVVSDSGIGMNDAQLARLFQPFTQADASTTRKYGGTGLGLTISKHFCEMMGGNISVSSTPGKGSVFTVTVPATVAERPAGPAPAPDPAAAAAESPARAGSRPTVLVIDDDDAIRDIMRKVLDKEGFHVVTAENGEQGLALARELRPVVITLDVLMPGMDGWQVLSALKSDPDLENVPVVMQTIVDDKKMGFTLGASEYLTKPIDRGQLSAIMKRLHAPESGGIVLIVESDGSLSASLAEMLSETGLRPMIAESREDAVRLVREVLPGLIMVDLLADGLDGIALQEELRALSEGKTPVVLITSRSLTPEEASRLNSKVKDVIMKSEVSDEEVVEKIRRQVVELTH